MPQRHWYIAVVTRNTEKAARERLARLGYESYVASRTEQRHYACRKTQTVERVLIPALLFVHATEQERQHLLTFPFIHRFLTDPTRPLRRTGSGTHPLATLTDQEMTDLQHLLTTSAATSSILCGPIPHVFSMI